MTYKVKGIITRYCTNYKICIRTEEIHKTNNKTYNLVFSSESNDDELEVKAFDINKEFCFDESLASLLSSIALKCSKVTFVLNDDKVIAVEINNE